MFRYDSYTEASRAKSDISKVLIGKDEDVMSVATEKESIDGTVKYSVKIGLKENSDAEKSKVFAMLSAAKLVPDTIAYSSDFYNAFKREGQVIGYSYSVSASDHISDPHLKSAYTQSVRPLFPGVSIGHIGDNSAGTLGAILLDPKKGPYILSNNHVLASTNKGKKGDAIIQPGRSDSGSEKVAELEHFSEIKMNSEQNNVDLAIAVLHGAEFKSAIPDIGELNATLVAQLGMEVKKTGRTTGHTEGKVESIDADVVVGYEKGQKAVFTDQIKTSKMSSPGDSGSLLVHKNNSGNAAVGLMFAGSPVNSYANHFHHVTSELSKLGYGTNFASSSFIKTVTDVPPPPKEASAVPSTGLTWLLSKARSSNKGLALATTVGIGIAAVAYAASDSPKTAPRPSVPS